MCTEYIQYCSEARNPGLQKSLCSHYVTLLKISVVLWQKPTAFISFSCTNKKKSVLCTCLYAVAKIYVKGSCVNKSLQLNFSDAFISTLLFYPKENKSQVSL